MMENRKQKADLWRKMNLIFVFLLVLLIISSFFVTYITIWKYLPVFKFHLLEHDRDLTVFAHMYMFGLNLGFFFQLFVLTFTLMIFFATKRTISFNLLYSVLLLRSLLILIQSSVQPKGYISSEEDYSVVIMQSVYLFVFIVFFIFNSIYDDKKRPRQTEPLYSDKEI
jgi:hypothetical protein